MAGHPIVALLVGKAMSGAFLAHGYQANRIIAFNAPGVLVHAMGKASAARITLRTEAELDKLGKTVLPMSYGIAEYAKLGLLYALLNDINADAPEVAHIEQVRQSLLAAIADINQDPRRDLSVRWNSPEAVKHRTATRLVRERLAAQWSGS